VSRAEPKAELAFDTNEIAIARHHYDAAAMEAILRHRGNA
jgi:hypothetical protein